MQLTRRVHAMLLLRIPSMAAFSPTSQAVAVRMALDIVAAGLGQPVSQQLGCVHVFGPTLGR